MSSQSAAPGRSADTDIVLSSVHHRTPGSIQLSRISASPIGGKSIRAASDFVGIGLSLLCLVHCLALPVLLAFAPAILHNLPGDDVTHRSLAVAVAMVGLIAFRSGYRVHRRRPVLGIFVAGLLLISIAAILGDEVLTAAGEAAVTVCGGILLISAHILNHSFCRSCRARKFGQECCPNIGEDSMRASSAACEFP